MATANEIEKFWQRQFNRLKEEEINETSITVDKDILFSTVQMLEERRESLNDFDRQYDQIQTLEKTNKELETAYDELYKQLQTLEKTNKEPKRADESCEYITRNESIMIRKLMDTYETTIKTLLAVIEKGV